MTSGASIRAYANCDDAFVVWRYPESIPGCRGFALFRRPEGGDPAPVQTFVPFAGEAKQEGEHRPSTEWPIQRFAWADVFARNGETLSYRVVPMVGEAGSLTEKEDLASPWSPPVAVSPDAGDGLSAFFNRGVLATQAISRRLKDEKSWTQSIREMIATPGNDTREYLSGELRLAMRKLLAEAHDSGAHIYAALFELDDPELIADLCALKSRAHVILANGDDDKGDENETARKELHEGGVEVHDRMTGSRLAHNKFLVYCDPPDSPQRVWTGSTNWTQTGLCTQVNNGLLIADEDVAHYYKTQWESLLKAGDEFPDDLVTGNSEERDAELKTSRKIGTWFAPVHDRVDLAAAEELIASAEEGILFLFFNPGPKETLFNAIMDRADPTSPHYDEKLYVHGVLNQDPQAGSKDPALVGLIHRGQLDEADPDIVLPSKVDERFAGWDKEIDRLSLVMVHSKVILLDPFGKRPVLMTGSHNLGKRASEKNDDNLNIVVGESRLAAAYATNIIAVYNNYRWRYVRSHAAKK
ncbi:MAG TPA: phospholipase D-like domain-containing protein, partial [Solirubrobacterales bacterium]|nr:phospholipase D-like domain-containing protein [Solirubrobacterales bacterium]